MTVEASPLGVRCNLRCSYCYENPMRDSQHYEKPDYNKIKQQLEKQGEHFTMFGGEPLLVPIDELEALWKFGYEKWGQNGIQTNGSLITKRHMGLFKKYKVHVGFSIDGPEELNDARYAGSIRATRSMTTRSNKNLEACLRDPEIHCSLIVNLHRLNASRNRLPKLLGWLHKLTKFGLEHIRLHFLEDNNAKGLMLTEDELFDALIDLESIQSVEFDIFKESKERLRTGQGGSCVHNGCDPFSTRAVQSVGPQGEMLNCGRTNKTGIDYLKADRFESTRSLVLRNTPQSDNGCQGCEYWYACTGNCPGTGVGGDWRNRTEYCSVLKRLFAYLCEKHDIKVLYHGCGNNKPEGTELCKCCHHDVAHQNSHGDSYIDSTHADGFTHANVAHEDTAHIDKTDLGIVEVRK